MEIQYIAPIVIGLVEVVKRTGLIGENFTPLLAIVIGVGISLTGGLTVENAINGIVAGLVSSGFWDSGKASLKIAGIIK